jgi:hypothetical protein
MGLIQEVWSREHYLLNFRLNIQAKRFAINVTSLDDVCFVGL